MRYFKIILVVLAAAAVGYAAAPKSPFDLPAPPERLPWMTDAMKAPCGKTEFEYRLAAGKVDPEPFPLWETAGVIATRFVGTPAARGLVVRCDMAFTSSTPPPSNSPKYRTALLGALNAVPGKCGSRFFPGDKDAFAHEKNLYILLYYNGKLVGVRTESVNRFLGPVDTEDAMIKELLTH